jgi:hypothetical protein
MRLLLTAALLAFPATSSAHPPAPTAPATAPSSLPEPSHFDRNNAHREMAGCTPIVQQVAGPTQRPPGSRLDQQPPAKMLLAVDRHVGGCHEVTFVTRRSAPAEPRP